MIRKQVEGGSTQYRSTVGLGEMSDIRENVLYSKETWEGEGHGPMDWSSRFITRLLEMVQEELVETGDRDWLVDAVEESSVRISHIEGISRWVVTSFLLMTPPDILQEGC